MRGQHRRNTWPCNRLSPPSVLGMDDLSTEWSFDLQATWVIDGHGLYFWQLIHGCLSGWLVYLYCICLISLKILPSFCIVFQPIYRNCMHSSMYSLYVFLSDIILIILHFPLFFSSDRGTVCIPVCIFCLYSSLILYSSFFIFLLFLSPDKWTVCIPVCILCICSSLILYLSFFIFLCFSAQIEELYAFQYVFFVCIPLWYYTYHSSLLIIFQPR